MCAGQHLSYFVIWILVSAEWWVLLNPKLCKYKIARLDWEQVGKLQFSFGQSDEMNIQTLSMYMYIQEDQYSTNIILKWFVIKYLRPILLRKQWGKTGLWISIFYSLIRYTSVRFLIIVDTFGASAQPLFFIICSL